MHKLRLISILVATAFGISACGGDDSDDRPREPIPPSNTYVLFNPVTGELPVPTDIQFASQIPADGTMFAGEDASNPVITGIDFLDGNSTIAPFDIGFTDRIDSAQSLDARSFVVQNGTVIPNPEQNVFLLPLSFPSGDSLRQASITTMVDGEEQSLTVEVPTFAEAAAYQTALATLQADPTNAAAAAQLSALATPTARVEVISLDGGTDNVIRINPLVPLQPKTKYLVVLTNVTDANAQAVQPSQTYDILKDPDTDFDQLSSNNPSFGRLASLRPAIQGWEQLALGYFGFKQTVYGALGVSASAPTEEDIIFSATFTTAGTSDVLQYMAAPDAFFVDSLSTAAKQDAIVKVVTGQYMLDGTTALTEAADIATAQTLGALLASPTLPGTEMPNPLYNAATAAAIMNGDDYATISGSSATQAHLIQRAAGEAAISVADGDGITIAQEAAGTVSALSGGGPVGNVFPVPAPRTTNFYRADAASDINPALQAPAQVYQGEITLPYYLTAPSQENPGALVTSFWQADETIATNIGQSADIPVTYRFPFPGKTADVKVPLLVTTPNAAVVSSAGITPPENGWPVIIFVHGITGERSTSLPIANAMASACYTQTETGLVATGLSCYATVAIDQPAHGIGGAGSLVPGINSVLNPNIAPEEGRSADLVERHFNQALDPVTNALISIDYDAGVGSSGSSFINLLNFMNSRDKLRQMSVDLLNLNASLDSMDLDSDGNADELDASRVYLMGHSLGAIDGLPFVAINNSPTTRNSPFASPVLAEIQAAVGFNTGGGVTRLLTNSQNFAPRILGGLAAASDSLVQGNSALESYFNVFQGILDSADVINYANLLRKDTSDTGILLTEIVGGGDVPADTTIPNAADTIYPFGDGPLQLTVPETGFMIDNFPAPLAGTEPLIAAFGAIESSSNPAEADSDPDVLVSRFIRGDHSIPADPTADLLVFQEFVIQSARFFAGDGDVTGSIVVNTELVVPQQ